MKLEYNENQKSFHVNNGNVPEYTFGFRTLGECSFDHSSEFIAKIDSKYPERPPFGLIKIEFEIFVPAIKNYI